MKKIGKLLMHRLLILLFLFFSNEAESKKNCNVPSALDGNYNIENLDDENPTKILGMLGNLFSWKLDDYDKCLHSDMVYEALFSLDTYESIQWKNKKNNTLGEIIILKIRPRQGGYCKDYKIRLKKNDKHRTLRKRACIKYCSHEVEFINLDNDGRCIKKNTRFGDPECGFTFSDMITNYYPVSCEDQLPPSIFR